MRLRHLDCGLLRAHCPDAIKTEKKKLFGWIWLPRIYPRLFLLPIPTWRWLLGFCFYDEYPSCLYCTNSNLRPFSSVSDAIDCDCISSWWFLVVFEAQHGGLTSKCTCYDGGRGGNTQEEGYQRNLFERFQKFDFEYASSARLGCGSAWPRVSPCSVPAAALLLLLPGIQKVWQ